MDSGMKQNQRKMFIILTAVFYMLVGVVCGHAQNREISILEIMEKWAAIEHAFMGEKVSGENNFNLKKLTL